MSRALRLGLLALGTAWTAPNTLMGLLLGAAGWLRGARPCVSDGAIVFHRYPWGPGGALTLGQVILDTGDSLDRRCPTYAHRAGLACRVGAHGVRLGDHERAHVRQYLVLGPLFLPLYLACGGVSVRNRFERAADRHAAGQGSWWPWRA